MAAAGARFPIGADLVLHEHSDPDQILLDGARLGQVLEQAARRYSEPLALALMDLTLEKQMLLERVGVASKEVSTWHFSEPPTDEMVQRARRGGPPSARIRASLSAVQYLAQKTDLVPVAMCIGPFSLMTKLIADPITPVFLAGSGVTAEEDPEVRTVETALGMAQGIVLEQVALQAEAGARAVFIAEPAANKIYLSPKQLQAGSDVFRRFVMAPNHAIKRKLDELGMELMFHCCGELVDDMVRGFASLDPALLSLGSSRRLWEDAALVPPTTVLYGNLPTKQFHSDDAITIEQVREQSHDLLQRMRRIGHPFILGSECDVLSVPGAHQRIAEKVQAFISA